MMGRNEPTLLTKEGKEKLEAELEYLTTVRRAEVAEAIRQAKEEGDISENAAYDEAKEAQAFLEGRIQTLQAMLRSVQIINQNGDSDVVRVGSQVTVAEPDGKPETYTIVGSAEVDPANGFISNVSPLGKALLGRRVGDDVRVEAPGGTINFVIQKIA
jgi:transcription elongation factor GreA